LDRQTQRALIPTPVGTIQIHATGHKLLRVELIGHILPPTEPESEGSPLLERIIHAIRAYLDGQQEDFQWVPLETAFLPPLHQKFYLWLREHVPYGTTRTYGDVAAALGLHPRSVGRILAQNPFPIVVPCHRIVAKTGLGGYSSGLKWKRFLLEVEGSFPEDLRRT